MGADGRKDGGGAGEGEAEGYLKRNNTNAFDFELCILMFNIPFFSLMVFYVKKYHRFIPK